MKNNFTKSFLGLAIFAALVVSCQSDQEAVAPTTDAPLAQAATVADMEAWKQQVITEEKAVENSRRGNRPVQVVDFVDIDRYAGRWFEIANFPSFFSGGCTCTTADYAPIDGGVSVFNNCIRNGENNSVRGSALVEDAETNAKLSVRFPTSPAPGEYWVVDLVERGKDRPYEFAVVSNSRRSSLFILSRKPQINSISQKLALFGIFRNLFRQGFDLSKVEFTPQPSDCDYPG